VPKIKNFTKINNFDSYDELFEQRGVKQISYDSLQALYVNFNADNHASKDHVWRRNDTMIRLANDHYGDYSLWHIIGFFNKKPTDHHFKAGETIKIPLNPLHIKSIIERN